MEKSENYRTSEYNQTNVHWWIFFHLFCKILTNVAYISARVNIVIISILIVSRQRHSSWNSALDVINLSFTTLSENRFRRLGACGGELNKSFKLICEPIHWFASWFDQAFEQNWLKRTNHLRMGIAHCPEKSRWRVWNKLKHFLL